jgi:ankyrin repeat protein
VNQELVVYRMVWWFQRLVRWLPRTLLTILLHRLLKADRAKAVAWLLTRTGQPVKHTFTTLRWGPARRRWEEVHLVHLAALHGSFHTLRWLLQHGADPNAYTRDGYCPVVIAALNGHADLMALLVSKGASPNSREPASGTTLEWWNQDEHRSTAVELLRSYHGREFRGDEHTHRIAQRLDAQLAPVVQATTEKRSRL